MRQTYVYFNHGEDLFRGTSVRWIFTLHAPDQLAATIAQYNSQDVHLDLWNLWHSIVCMSTSSKNTPNPKWTDARNAMSATRPTELRKRRSTIALQNKLYVVCLAITQTYLRHSSCLFSDITITNSCHSAICSCLLHTSVFQHLMFPVLPFPQ